MVSSEEPEKCLNAGMNDHIAKPVNVCELHNVMAKWTGPRSRVKKQSERRKSDGSGLPPQLDGFDLPVALSRVEGSSRLLKELIQTFAETCVDAPQDIAKALKAGDRVKALAVAHMVKGVAGNIGAVDLFEVAKELEAALKVLDSQDWRKSYQKFETEHARVLKSAKTLCASGVARSVSASPVAGADIPGMVVDLADLLEANDLESLSLMDRLESILPPSDELRSLSRKVSELQFPEALQALQQFRQKHMSTVPRAMGEEVTAPRI
jgi:HPt (histidine-containing phosphotransfer) domain-containing protein